MHDDKSGKELGNSREGPAARQTPPADVVTGNPQVRAAVQGT